MSVSVQVKKDAEADPNVEVEAADWFRRMDEGDGVAYIPGEAKYQRSCWNSLGRRILNLAQINYGSVQGMSTRKGTAMSLHQIIKEAADVMHEQMQKNEENYNAVEGPETASRRIGIMARGVKIM